MTCKLRLPAGLALFILGTAAGAEPQEPGRLLFHRYRDTGQPYPNASRVQLTLSDANGANQVGLGEWNPLDASTLQGSALSPDGSRVAYVAPSPPPMPFMPPVHGSTLYFLKAEALGGDNWPGPVANDVFGSVAWSPDGRKVAFNRLVGGKGHIFILNAVNAQGLVTPEGAGNQAVQVTTQIDGQVQGFVEPAFSPDGSTLLFHEFYTEGYNGRIMRLSVVNAEGAVTPQAAGNPVLPLTVLSNGNTSYTASEAAWSPDGRKIIFVSTHVGFDPPEYQTLAMLTVRDSNGNWTPEGAGNMRATFAPDADGEFYAQPTWSPDGSLIAYGHGGGVKLLLAAQPQGPGNQPVALQNIPAGADSPSFGTPKLNAVTPPQPNLPSAPSDIVAWWPSENAVGDIIGNAHVAVDTGTQEYVQGMVGQAFSFNGIDQSAMTTEPTTIMNHLPLTIEGWVKPTAHDTGSINDPLPPNVISNDKSLFGGHGFGVHIYPNGSKLNIGVQAEEEDFYNVPGVTFQPDQWVHIAVVYTPGKAKVYKDGLLKWTFTYTQAPLAGQDIVRIGRHNDDTGYGTRRFFKGAVDEISLYHRALNSAEIDAIFSAGAAGKASDDASRQFVIGGTQNPAARWKYGQLESGNFALFDTPWSEGALAGWITSNSAIVGINPTANLIVNAGARYHLPHHIFLHPSDTSPSKPAVLRWTAPQAGNYAFAATFNDLDVENAAVKGVVIFHNQTPKFSGSISGHLGNGLSRTLQFPVAAGDTVDFVVNQGSDGTSFADLAGISAAAVRLAPPTPDIALEQPVGTDLASFENAVNFGDTVVSESSQKTFTIRNTGDAPLTGLGATIDGFGSEEFTISGLSTTTLAAGASTTFTVTFSPTVKQAYSVSLAVASDDPDENPFVVELFGAGITDPPGVIAFASATATVNEKMGVAHLKLVRTNGSSGPVSVTVNTAAGSASVADFTLHQENKVHFASGQTSKMLTLHIVRDSLTESSESFTVNLSAPGGGASLGAITTATVTIVDVPDTTPPALAITHSWVEKSGTGFAYRFLLDVTDNSGLQKVQARWKTGSTANLPDSTPWIDKPWLNGTPFTLTLTAATAVIEIRAVDAAGNASPLQRRTFAAPAVLSAPPLLVPKVVSRSSLESDDIDCRGLFTADFDGDGRDDIAEVDNLADKLRIRRQLTSAVFTVNEFDLGAGAINDSACADLNKDGKPDLIIVASGSLVIYLNDGLGQDGGLQFSHLETDALATTGFISISHVCVGDMDEDGLPDIIVSGEGEDASGTVTASVATLFNAAETPFTTASLALGFDTASPGPVEVGDVTGDGWLDVVMLDEAGFAVMQFKSKTDGTVGGLDDATYEARPAWTVLGPDLTPHALAVGDLDGDGIDEAVVTYHSWADNGGGTGFNTFNWCILASRGPSTMQVVEMDRPNSASPILDSPTSFRSDVILDDLTGDGLPEVIVTEPFFMNGEPDNPIFGGLGIYRVALRRDSANLVISSRVETYHYLTGSNEPHRLAAGSLGLPGTRQIALASAAPTPLQLITTQYVTSNKQYDLIGSAKTDKDLDGDPAVNGTRTYFTKVNDEIHYTLHYINNSATPLTDAILECALPAGLILNSADPGFTLVANGKTSTWLRWTINSPAGLSGSRKFTVRATTGKNDSEIALSAALRQGTKTLAATLLPRVTLEDPLVLRLTVISDSDPAVGARVHVDEVITYELSARNNSSAMLTGVKFSMAVPGNCVFFDADNTPSRIFGGTFPEYTSVTWPNISIAPNAERSFKLKVKVKPTAEVGKPIKMITGMVTRGDGVTTSPPSTSTMVEPLLEITLSGDKTIVRPGEVIRYTFTARNWGKNPVTDARVVFKLPVGTSLLAAGANDNADAPDGKGNFKFSAGTWQAQQLSTTTSPGFDRANGVMRWLLGTMPANVARNIEFDVIVGQDIPTSRFTNGVHSTLEVSAMLFNFVGTPPSGSRIFAGKPATAAGTAANATSSALLSSALQASRSLLSDPPLAAPQLTLNKTATGTLSESGNDFVYTVPNDVSNHNDGVYAYVLEYRNAQLGPDNQPSGPALGLRIVDYLPKDVVFAGYITKDGYALVSLVGCRFYDSAGKEMKVIGAEGFTDTNQNGFFDVGEPYADSNGNKKYDGPVAALVRSLELPIGSLNAGMSGAYSYAVSTNLPVNSLIVSKAATFKSVTESLVYSMEPGYHMRADNLHFPIKGAPQQLKVKVTLPATTKLTAMRSQNEVTGTGKVELAVRGKVENLLTSLASNLVMNLEVPVGHMVTSIKLADPDGAWEQVVTARKPTDPAAPNTAPLTPATATAPGKLAIAMGAIPDAVALVQYAVDPAKIAALRNTQGETKGPAKINISMAGQYTPSAGPSAASSHATLAGAVKPVTMTPATTTVTFPERTDLDKDAKIFVGRTAPSYVYRGSFFEYTIFVGNLTDKALGAGRIEMDIPDGCDYITGSDYRYQVGGSPVQDYGTKCKRSGKKLTWDIGSLLAGEGGAVTVKMFARSDFKGNRIDDNTCIFDVRNACGKTPGALGIVVLDAGVQASAATILQGAVEGLQCRYSTDVADALRSQLSSYHGAIITCGGADILKIENGTAVIQMHEGSGRVMVVGPPDKVSAPESNMVNPYASVRVAVGAGDASGIKLKQLPDRNANASVSANEILQDLGNPAASLVAKGKADVLVGGGSNLIRAGAPNVAGVKLDGPNGAAVILPAGLPISVHDLAQANAARVLSHNGSTMVAAGGMNAVPTGGGHMVAAGAGNVLSHNGSTIQAVGAVDLKLIDVPVGNLVAQDGAVIVTGAGSTILAVQTGNIIQSAGAVTIPNTR
jgi:uncharacterized repeat protein (TIGR01451 family)